MEKEKPYKCDVCGKRYKNLNGLKYVRAIMGLLALFLLTFSSTSNILHRVTQK